MTVAADNALNFADLLREAVSKPGFLSSAYSAFHNYSFGNMLAAAFQLAQRGQKLQPIASFMGWQKVNRKVKKGSKALVLCMPVSCKAERTHKDGTTEEVAFQRFFWNANWFALCDTEGEGAAPKLEIPDWDADRALAALGITVEPFAMGNGNCQGYAQGKSIAINPVAALPHKTRFHEMAHVVLGHTEERMEDDEHTPRDMREVEAESTAYILLNVLKLPGLAESRGYIQHWLKDADIPEKNAQRIFKAADRILKAGRPAVEAAEPAAPEAKPEPEAKPAKELTRRQRQAKADKAKADAIRASSGEAKPAKRSPAKDAQRASRKPADPPLDPAIAAKVAAGEPVLLSSLVTKVAKALPGRVAVIGT